MRIVIDTNVLVSEVLWHGAPHTLPERIRNDTATLVTNPVLIDELDKVLQRASSRRRCKTPAPRANRSLQRFTCWRT